MANFDLTNLAVKMSCPTNEVIIDDKGMPSVYVRRTAQTLKALLKKGNDTIHPAFLVENDQKNSICIGKFQGISHNSRFYSLPAEDPASNITLDTVETYCKNKGVGHHCITAAEWGFLALLAKANKTIPLGNNNNGKDHSETMYQAIPTTRYGNQAICHVATGTGPVTWSDTHTIDGIWDLNGNVWEWVSGLRLVYGELQVIPYNNAASKNCDTSASSPLWKAVNTKATGYTDLYLDPTGNGTTANSVRLDYVSSHWQWQNTAIQSSADETRSASFNATTSVGLSDFCNMYLRAMALLPDEEDQDYGGDYFWANNAAAERCARRGGDWGSGARGGVFSLGLDPPRSNSHSAVGGRPAFYE